jgi:hypothetical protein
MMYPANTQPCLELATPRLVGVPVSVVDSYRTGGTRAIVPQIQNY